MQQDDGPKRVRDARKHLQPGIMVLGHQGSHPRIADAFGLVAPSKGSWIAVKVKQTTEPEPGTIEIEGKIGALRAKQTRRARTTSYQ